MLESSQEFGSFLLLQDSLSAQHTNPMEIDNKIIKILLNIFTLKKFP
jgi:hypothetical protein